MGNKTWKQRLEDGERAREIVFSEPQMDLISWHEKYQSEGLTASQTVYIIRCAERFDRTMKNYCF
jgi:hypothetical protein